LSGGKVDWCLYKKPTSLKEYPMHKRQHAFRKGHSFDDALTGTVNTIEHAMHNGQFAVTVFLDIYGAFDNITSDAIVLATERHHIDPEIAGWYEFYLRNRLCESTLGDKKAFMDLSIDFEKGRTGHGIFDLSYYGLFRPSLLQ
jgi:hypothetical protein